MHFLGLLSGSYPSIIELDVFAYILLMLGTHVTRRASRPEHIEVHDNLRSVPLTLSRPSKRVMLFTPYFFCQVAAGSRRGQRPAYHL